MNIPVKLFYRSLLIFGILLILCSCVGLYMAVFKDDVQFKGTIQPVYRGFGETIWYEPQDPADDQSCFRPGEKLRPGKPESYIGPIEPELLRLCEDAHK